MQTRFIVLTEEKIENNNPVSTIDKYLNTLEEHRTFPIGTMTNTCVRCNALESVASAIVKYENTSAQQLCPFCLIKVFCDKSDIIRKKTGREIIDPTKPIFPSIPEITAADLGEEFINILREKSESDNFTFDDMQAGKKIEPYHKYYAIVQADGDNVGKFASEIIKNGNDSGKPPSEYETILSERMSVFAEKAYLLTKKDFNGHAVYIGGDDLLALMPVAYQSDESTLKTVVDYAVALNNLYKENVCDPIKNKLTVIKDTTLSIGISISYYKYPLSLALDNAGRLLFDKAKSDTKNGCAINLIKHSGASKEIVLRFSKLSELEFFSGLLKNALKKDSPLIHAIHHKLGIFLPLLSKLETQDQIANFLTYRFDMPEDIEQDKIKDKNIELYYVKKMLEDAVSSVDKNIAISNVINKLALIKFLRGDAE
jgi:CRISPR-associated protein Cmr2